MAISDRGRGGYADLSCHFSLTLCRLPRTGTEKIQKALLQKEGVDPTAVKSDSVYWLQGGKYTPFTMQDWERLQDGKVKL